MCHQHISNEEGKRERAKCPGLNIFHHEVRQDNRDWRAHGCAMYLPIEGIAERKVSGIEAELKQGGDLVSDVRPVKKVSFWRRCEVIWMARSTETLVKEKLH